jgi:hypothetical protein
VDLLAFIKFNLAETKNKRHQRIQGAKLVRLAFLSSALVTFLSEGFIVGFQNVVWDFN